MSGLHFSIIVKDATESIRFYNAIAPFIRVVSDMASGSGERFVDMGMPEGNIFLRLVQPHSVSALRMAYLQKKKHVSIQIDVHDLELEINRLHELGYSATNVQIEPSFQIATYVDPDKNEICLQRILLG
jgi:predicted enzyme related to lactoylglutathione lyase